MSSMHYRRIFIRLVAAVLLTGLVLVLALVTSAGITGQSGTVSDTEGGRLEVIDGVTVVTLTGTPREMGRQHGSILGDRMLESEAAFRHIMPQIPGGAFGEWLLKLYVMFRLDGIEMHLTDAELDEMKGMAEAGPDKDRDYRDLLYYHVLQDIGQNYACTGAAVCGNRSSLQGPVAGRNFDLNKDGVLDPLKTVFVYIPDEGQPYATVAWPGMAGAVSGMNGYGVCLMVFSARAEGTSMSGVPVAFIARRVLAGSKDVDGAVALITGTPRMGSNVFLVADTRRAVAVEFDAYRVAVREVTNGVLPVANHMLCEEFISDEKNVRQKKYSDSRQRLDRVEQVLLKKRRAGPEEMLAALRDHSGPEGGPMTWSDPAAVNNVKDAHSVIFDPAGRRFWVSAPPMAYGRFSGFRLGRKGITAVKPLPGSGYPDSAEGERAISSDALYWKAVALSGQGMDDNAVNAAYGALAEDPCNYMAALLAGRLLSKAYRYDEAYLAYDSAVYHAPGCSSTMAEALAGRGEAGRHTGRSEQAMSDFKAAVSLDCSQDATEAASRGLARM